MSFLESMTCTNCAAHRCWARVWKRVAKGWRHNWRSYRSVCAQRDAAREERDRLREALKGLCDFAHHGSDCFFTDGDKLCECGLAGASERARAALSPKPGPDNGGGG